MTRPRKQKPAGEHLLISEDPKTDWQRALIHIEENIKLYIGGAIFVLLCVVVGALIRVGVSLREKEIMTRYAEAALVEDAAERLEKYQAISSNAGDWTPEVLYRMGETALEAGNAEAAEQAFQRILNEFASSPFAVNAADGLAFIAWNKNDLESALAQYQALVEKYPGEFIARRKYNDIAKLQEALNRPADAIASYKKQQAVFPDSAAAGKAEQALTALREKHPDLFPEEGEGEAQQPEDAANTAVLTTAPNAADTAPES